MIGVCAVSAGGIDRSAWRVIGGGSSRVGVCGTFAISAGGGATVNICMRGAISRFARCVAAIHVGVLGAATPPMLGAAAVDIRMLGSLAVGMLGAAAPGIGMTGLAVAVRGAAAEAIRAVTTGVGPRRGRRWPETGD